ncbi:SCL-interrupting locus protein isoform X2 [Spea bombifrons]|uniref:SCL-interrupting locus protein isoform X2 n=1 Tax=Spea bombifrons TaxID=233779 RepID=UPI00234AF216|nr:SCL-interrupting locus protein isoform X2 [Spea bombifrons]
MTAKMSLKNFQSHKEAGGLSAENQINLRNMSNRLLPLSFPPSKIALWDSTPVGNPIGLHASYYRNPRLLLSEKALRLSYRHAKSERRPFSCFLLGSFSVDEDEEGITLTIDRFDPGREKGAGGGKAPSALLPGDFLVPCSIVTRESSGPSPAHTPEDFKSSLQGLQNHLHSKEALDLSKLLTVRAHITYTEDMDNLHFDLHWAAITMANTFESVPVRPVPIIPTALARNLSSHNNIAQLQGTHKCGYLTMDQTRKLLLVLESDPKVYTLPLVGIWLSGVTHIHNPLVWSSCLRYMFNSSVKERVFSEHGSFLIVLYSRTHKEPEFYECVLCSGHDSLGFQLLTNEDALHLFKNVDVTRKTHLQFEFSTENHNPEMFLFNEASKSISATVIKQSRSPNRLSISDHDSGVEDEDFSPRPSPRPHPSVQQVTRIHPSVPELSLVFSSLIESKSASQNPENGGNLIQPFTSTPDNVNKLAGKGCPLSGIQTRENQDSFLRPSLGPVNSKAPTKKHSKGKLGPSDTQPAKSSDQTRRNSTSSSSSAHSTPQYGSSPDTSALQNRPEPNARGQHHGQPPMKRSAHCRQMSAPQSPGYNVTFPLPSRQSVEHTKQSASLQPFYQNRTCNCCHNVGPVQCHSPSSWPCMGHVSHHTIENELEAQGVGAPAHPNVACPNLCCSPVCVSSCQKSSVNSGPSPVDNLMSPGRRDSLPVNAYSPHSCQHTPPPDNGMLGLSAEAYRLLAEQDKQLKTLQAQIQRLLEAQTPGSDSSKPSPNNGSSQKQVESVSTETLDLPKKTSVSIAVSTGASLFWNSPYPDEEVSADQQDDSALCTELSTTVNNERDTSRTSIASSLKAVDICSFAESSQLTDKCNNSSSPLQFPLLHRDVPSPDSVNIQAPPAELLGSSRTAEAGENIHSVPQENFYKDLMCQVNHLLKTSAAADEEYCESVTSPPSREYNPAVEKKKPRSSPPSQHDDVLKATLKQLKNLGVNMDSSDIKPKKLETADNACVLACINPDAIIPRLNYMSFMNVGMSGFGSSGVDLSMEANAIALKYLSESQLTQLSLSHTNKSKALDSTSIARLFPGNTDKSMVGLSLISPSNMSFATKKYMKRYALIDGSDSSDDEADPTSQNSSSLNQTTSEGKWTCPDNSSISESFDVTGDGAKHGRNHSSKAVDYGFANHPETNKLRNITNEVPSKCGTAPQRTEEVSLPFLKDLKTRKKLISGKAQFTRHPEKENAGNQLVFIEKDSSLKQIPDCPGSLGDILDVNRLRQLPKLF